MDSTGNFSCEDAFVCSTVSIAEISMLPVVWLGDMTRLATELGRWTAKLSLARLQHQQDAELPDGRGRWRVREREIERESASARARAIALNVYDHYLFKIVPKCVTNHLSSQCEPTQFQSALFWSKTHLSVTNNHCIIFEFRTDTFHSWIINHHSIIQDVVGNKLWISHCQLSSSMANIMDNHR